MLEGEKEKTTTRINDNAMTTTHGSSTMELAQEAGMLEGEKEKTTTPIDDVSKSVGDEI